MIKLKKNFLIKAHEIDEIKIIRIESDLHATNAAKFKKLVYELTKIKPQEFMAKKNHLKISTDSENLKDRSRKSRISFSFLIIDCSPINFIDSVGVKTINQVKIKIKKFSFFKFCKDNCRLQ